MSDKDPIEHAFWLFDDYKKNGLPDTVGGRTLVSERDAFKRAVREVFATSTLDQCPIHKGDQRVFHIRENELVALLRERADLRQIVKEMHAEVTVALAMSVPSVMAVHVQHWADEIEAINNRSLGVTIPPIPIEELRRLVALWAQQANHHEQQEVSLFNGGHIAGANVAANRKMECRDHATALQTIINGEQR